MLCASVEDALRWAVAHAGHRRAFGSALLGHQGLAAALEGARGLVDRAARLIETGADAQVEAAFAKKAAVEMAALERNPSDLNHEGFPDAGWM